MDRLVEARAHCKAALDVDPSMTAARNNLALTFVASGDAAAARQAFLAAGDPAGAAYNRGIVHMASREYTRAAEAFEEAIAARPEVHGGEGPRARSADAGHHCRPTTESPIC